MRRRSGPGIPMTTTSSRWRSSNTPSSSRGDMDLLELSDRIPVLTAAGFLARFVPEPPHRARVPATSQASE